MARWGSVTVVIKVECSAGDGNEWSRWQYIGTSTERTGGISIVGGGEEVTTEEEIDKGGGVGKEEPLGSGVCSGSQSSVCSVGKERQVVHPGVVMLEGRVSGDEEQEVRVVVVVREEELIVCNGRVCEQEERNERRRRRGEVSYSPPGQTSRVLTPARLSKSLLQPNIPSIGSGTCVLTENHGGIRSFQSRILLLLLLNRVVELGSSSHGLHSLCTALEGKCGMCGGFSMSWGGRVSM